MTAAGKQLSLGSALDFMRGLWQLNHALERHSSKMEDELDVSAQQHWIIRCVGKYPGVTAGQLASQLHLDPGTVSAALGRLERKAMLERRRDPRDRRRVVLGLTRRGRALYAASTLENAVDELLATSEPHAVAATLQLLSSLSERLAAGAIADGAAPRAKRRARSGRAQVR
jgi:MarR family transcriptional regulator, organic hydroperoxide resistance regulator